MLPFEAIEPTDPLRTKPIARPPFPLYVEPAPEEALLSWLLRLATRLRVSLRALAIAGFGIDERTTGSQWWCRPHPWLLMRISQRTGVSVARLRQMTVGGFEPAYRDDEACGRFAGRRYDSRAPQSRAFCFALCGHCVQSDVTPYLRRLWLIGWVAVCPDHGTILIERCNVCHSRLRLASLGTRSSFSPCLCIRCKETLLGGPSTQALSSVLRLQRALLTAKSRGAVELKGLGALTWREIVALVDVLNGMVWTALTVAEQEQLWIAYMHAFRTESREPTDIYESRHDSLCFLAWLLEGWPHGEGPSAARELLERWFNAEHNRICRHLRSRWADPWSSGPSNFDPPIRERLRALASAP